MKALVPTGSSISKREKAFAGSDSSRPTPIRMRLAAGWAPACKRKISQIRNRNRRARFPQSIWVAVFLLVYRLRARTCNDNPE